VRVPGGGKLRGRPSGCEEQQTQRRGRGACASRSETDRGVTPLGVKHVLASKALVIIISYMVIIACSIDHFKFKVEKQLLKTQILHSSTKEW
jgi:hypothetical protein